MRIIHTVNDFRKTRSELRGPVGFVPTMGYLHEGHLALVRRARAENSAVVVSIFVNPTQFDRANDLERYPRDLERDLALLREEGVDLVFAPEGNEMYPEGYSTTVHVAAITETLEGAHRPGHFDGVATVVAKLFNIVQPNRAYFGQKDAQQLVVVRRMVSNLNFPIEVVPVPTVREPDGLALSSRNALLEGEARQQATALWHALSAARAAWRDGEREAEKLRVAAQDVLDRSDGVRVEYLELTHPETLEPLKGSIEQGLLSTAAWVGGVRLIDNIALEEG